jgi:hypothetical protein
MTTPQPGANVAQSISFITPPNRELGFSYPLTNIVATSKLPVTVVSTTPQTCVVNQVNATSWTVSAAAGVGGDNIPCTLQASQPGVDTVWAPAVTQTRTFYWNKAAMAIRMYNAISTRTGVGPFGLIASYAYVSGVNNVGIGGSLPGDVTVTTSTPAVCSVNSVTPVQISTGTYAQANIAGKTNGICTTTWTTQATSTRTAATLTYSFTVTGIK